MRSSTGDHLKNSEHATQISIFTFTVSQRKSVNFAEAVVSTTYDTTVVSPLCFGSADLVAGPPRLSF